MSQKEYECKLVKALPPETLTFVAVFARIEYALKRAGYLKRCNCGGLRADPDWDAFAKDLGSTFLARVCQAKSAPLFFEKPPRKQVVPNGRLDFEEESGVYPNSTGSLLVLVRRVRNNLFHGGKFPNAGEVRGSERDGDLVKQALWVLNEAMTACSECPEDRCGNVYKEFQPHYGMHH